MKKEPKTRKTETIARRSKPGHPSLIHDYEDEICLKVEELALKGCTNVEIATAIGISLTTLHEWRRKYPHFQHALNKHRGLANLYVENALFKSATGYDFQEQAATPKGEVVTVIKHQPASVNAQKFYLTNRMPDRYKNKVETTMQLGETVDQMVVAIKRRE